MSRAASLSVVAAALLAGCAAPAAPASHAADASRDGASASGAFDGLYGDADVRIADALATTSRAERTVSYRFGVPDGVAKVGLARSHAFTAPVTLGLGPTGHTSDLTTTSERGWSRADERPTLFVNATPGEWVLSVTTSGNAAYAFGIYFEPGPHSQ